MLCVLCKGRIDHFSSRVRVPRAGGSGRLLVLMLKEVPLVSDWDRTARAKYAVALTMQTVHRVEGSVKDSQSDGRV